MGKGEKILSEIDRKLTFAIVFVAGRWNLAEQPGLERYIKRIKRHLQEARNIYLLARGDHTEIAKAIASFFEDEKVSQLEFEEVVHGKRVKIIYIFFQPKVARC